MGRMVRARRGELVIPALRERKDDIPALVQRFLAAHGPPRTLADLPPDALALLMAHSFLGNVRELLSPTINNSRGSWLVAWTSTARTIGSVVLHPVVVQGVPRGFPESYLVYITSADGSAWLPMGSTPPGPRPTGPR